MDVLIVGGGASGMMAAIAAASNGAHVTIYERNQVLGKKILSTGNGRCNLGNRDLRLDYYNSNDCDRLNDFFVQFDAEDTIATFRSFGLMIKERNGYLYPASDQAVTVRDILTTQIKGYEVEVRLEAMIQEIIKLDDGRFKVTTDKDERLFDKVILSCGSYAGLRKTERVPSDVDGYSLAYHLGHHIVPVKPALTQIICEGDAWKKIAGVRAECLISLGQDGVYIGSDIGEVQFTETGVSGIPSFQLSREVAAHPDHEYTVVLDLMPGINEDDYISLMQNRMLTYQNETVADFFLGILNSKLNDLIIEMAGLNPEDIICDETEDAVINAISLIKCLSFKVKGTKSFENAQCCSGGVPISEIDDCCQSLACPGLYITGEMLDVDGRCGGYNLQWAWTTGYIAGSNASKIAED